MRIKYSPDVREKLRQMRKYVGQNKISKITKSIRGLIGAPYKCPAVENMLGVSNPYYFLHVEQYYIFYRVENDIVFIADIYNRKFFISVIFLFIFLFFFYFKKFI